MLDLYRTGAAVDQNTCNSTRSVEVAVRFDLARGFNSRNLDLMRRQRLSERFSELRKRQERLIATRALFPDPRTPPFELIGAAIGVPRRATPQVGAQRRSGRAHGA